MELLSTHEVDENVRKMAHQARDQRSNGRSKMKRDLRHRAAVSYIWMMDPREKQDAY